MNAGCGPAAYFKEEHVKKARIILALATLAVVLSIFVGCAGAPPLRKGDVLIEDKGTAYGIKTPKWVEIAILGGAKEIERQPEYKEKVVFIGTAEAMNLPSAELFASRMDAQTEIASYLSTRVKDAFKGANVANADSANFGQYGERFVASVAEAKYAGFRKDADWWVKVQTYTSEGKADKQIYRVQQLWTMEKTMLQKQFDIILGQIAGNAPATPETKRAIDLVQNTVTKDFFGDK
jgi:hypothetical protein